jgi:hypothetical protein
VRGIILAVYLTIISIFDRRINYVVLYKSAKFYWLLTVYGMAGILDDH